MINKEIFRAYDIRGVAYEQLSESTTEQIGLALGSQALAQNCKTIVIGRDGRLSSPALWAALVRGLLATGINIIDVGMVPTPVLYFASFYYQTNCGAMLTGSHNPGQYNGIKMIIAGRSISGDEITNLYQRILKHHDVEIPWPRVHVLPAVRFSLHECTLSSRLRGFSLRLG